MNHRMDKAAGRAVFLLLALGSMGAILAALACSSFPLSRRPSPSGLARQFAQSVRPPSSETTRLLRNAAILRSMGRSHLAVKELEEALLRDPGDLKIMDTLAQIYEELGDFPRAQALYEAALKREPDHPAVRNNLCFSYYQSGAWEKAESCFREALRQNPDNTLARNNLGLLLVRQGRQAEALALWEERGGEALARERLHQALAALGLAPPVPQSSPTARAPAPSPKVTPPPAEPRPAPVVAAPEKAPASEAATAPAATTPAAPAPPGAATRAAAPSSQKSVTSSPLQAAAGPLLTRPPEKATPSPAPVTQAAEKKETGAAAGTASPAVRSPAPPAPVAAREKAPAPRTAVDPAAASPVTREPRPGAAAAPAAAGSRAGLQSTRKSATPSQPKAASEATPAVARPSPVPVSPAPEKKKGATALGKAPAAPAPVKSVSGSEKSPAPPRAPAAAKVTPAAVPAPVASGAAHAKAKATGAASSAPAPAAMKPAGETAPAPAMSGMSGAPAAQELLDCPLVILNGNGREGIARKHRLWLEMEGFTVSQVGNFRDFGQARTSISYLPPARRVARLLRQHYPQAELKEAGTLPREASVLVVLGRDQLAREARVDQRLAKLRALAAAQMAGPAPAVSPAEGKKATPAAVFGRAPGPAASFKASVSLTAAELIQSRICLKNGNGIPGLARTYRSLLAREGFTVAEIGNHLDFGMEQTLILYRPDAARVAQALAARFFPQAILKEAPPSDSLEVKVILGKDLTAPTGLMAHLGP